LNKEAIPLAAKLDGIWKASDGVSSDLSFVKIEYDDSAWSDVQVPGHWQTTPAFEKYPEKLIYRKLFEANAPSRGRRVFLRFSGVFYFCRVWLNGVYLGEHTGYFAPFEFEVTSCLRDGANLLSVFVRCEIEASSNDKKQVLGVFGNWDCKPKETQPGGIWNSVDLIEVGQARLSRLNVSDFQIREDEAVALARAAVFPPANLSGGELKLLWRVEPANYDDECQEGEFLIDEANPSGAEATFEISIPEPKLWWPWDRGEQPLYRLRAKLMCGDVAADEADTRFGVRTVEMKDWILRINGKRLFCRGSNYAPADIRLSRATRDIYEKDIEMAVRANLNMLRVHAHVEKKEFYETCDERGVLVWQDFPLQWHYSKEILKPAVEQIADMARELISHPSVAVWCCHNEPFKITKARTAKDILAPGALKEFIPSMASMLGPDWNKDELDPRLKAALLKEDKSRPIVQSSGTASFLKDGTDTHLYFGWYYGTMRMLKGHTSLYKKACRFVTEYGAQAYPSVESFRELQDVDSIKDIDWESLEKNNMLQRDLMNKYVPARRGKKIGEYIEVSQWYQARLVKYYNEFLRRMKYEPCGGAVHFMFNDCCPAVTWSVIDWRRAPKKGYFALKESFSPALAMSEFPKRWYLRGETLNLKLWAVNDFDRDFPDAAVRWLIFDSEGNCRAEGMAVAPLPADSVIEVGRVRWDSSDCASGGYALVVELKTNEASEPVVNQYEFEIRK
jgi:beta-mannosidase